MPIRKELRAFYGRRWREETRPRILARAGGHFSEAGRYICGAKCERCGVLDRRFVVRAAGWWLNTSSPCMNCMVRMDFERTKPPCNCGGYWVSPIGQQTETPAANFPLSIRRIVMIHITVAHLNHVPGDDRDENLAALCQWCHLHHDLEQHHETRAARKDAGRPLIALIEREETAGANPESQKPAPREEMNFEHQLTTGDGLCPITS